MVNTREHLAHAGRIGGLTRASRYSPQELTAKARAGFLARFLTQVDANTPGLPENERQRRANALLKAHMSKLAHRSAKVRRQKAQRRNGTGGQI
ncbi:MAG: hypothetical protein Q8P59_00505 [Dehalococcoidia bacterium]|nr:hypothetical protein [Dehalococcoidia bacterium]